MNDFENLVLEMRVCQTNYFKTRERYWLEQSKHYEKLVDRYFLEKKNPKLNLDG